MTGLGRPPPLGEPEVATITGEALSVGDLCTFAASTRAISGGQTVLTAPDTVYQIVPLRFLRVPRETYKTPYVAVRIPAELISQSNATGERKQGANLADEYVHKMIKSGEGEPEVIALSDLDDWIDKNVCLTLHKKRPAAYYFF